VALASEIRQASPFAACVAQAGSVRHTVLTICRIPTHRRWALSLSSSLRGTAGRRGRVILAN
jgi:hypothetical protein